MLLNLRVKNLALVEDADIAFQPGMSVFTGETGAGKSLLLAAIAMLLGNKARTELVRDGAQMAEVEGAFEIPKKSKTHERLLEMGFASDEGQEDLLIVRREISRDEKHRNRIWIQGRLATRNQLQELLGDWVEISGQHEFLRLNREDYALDILDGALENKDLLEGFEEAFRNYQNLKKELHEAKQAALQKETRLEYLRFQLQEFEKLKISEDLEQEEQALLQVRQRLANLEKISTSLDQIFEACEGDRGDASALSAFKVSMKNLAALRPVVQEASVWEERFSQIQDSLSDLLFEMRRYSSSLSADPQSLEDAEERLSVLQRLKRKYHVETAGLLSLWKDLKEEREKLESSENWIGELEKNFEKSEKQLKKIANTLSETRQLVAKKVTKAWMHELKKLGLPQAQVSFVFQSLESVGARGAENCELHFSANPGERMGPLSKQASGGELSRLLLALKSVLSSQQEIGIFLFDEIDTGVGGETALYVGEKLKTLSRYNQVLVVTHLAQVAAFADIQYRISKKQEAGRTKTSIQKLKTEDRVREIARMMGDTDSKSAQKLAREMMEKTHA